MSINSQNNQNAYAGCNSATKINKRPDDIPIVSPQIYQINGNKNYELSFVGVNGTTPHSNTAEKNKAISQLSINIKDQNNKILKYERYEEDFEEELTGKDTNKKVKWYELLFLFCDIIVVTSIFFLSKEKNYLSFACSFIGCFSIWFLAKGMYFAPIFNAVYDILYIVLSYSQCYFGEAIIYVFMTLPIDVYSIFAWRKNKSESSGVVKFNKITKREFSLLSFGTLAVTIAFYFILKSLDTSQVIVSTISIIPSAMAAYLLLKRNNFYSLAYVANDIILITLWSITVFQSGISNLPIVINFICCFIIDFYGFINLQKELKKQEMSKEIPNA